MAIPPIVSATLQSAVLSATSNVLAQAITAYMQEAAFVIDWVPVFQFVLFTLVITPPNFLWQEFLESSFPATHVSPTNEALASAAKGDEKELDREAKEGRLVEPKLNIKNTLIKFVLDQSIGAAVNTFAFSMFIHSIKMAMSGQPEHLASPDRSVSYLLSGKSIDYSRVDWIHVVAKSRAEFLSIMSAGTRLWPFVSLVNFAFVKSVEGRNLIGSLAGVGWGIYMSLLAARK